MATTSNLLVTLIEANQAGKHISANEAFNAFDRIFADALSLDGATLASPYTLTSPDPALRTLTFTVTGALSADWVLVHPAARHLFVVRNSTTGGYAVQIRTPSGTPVSVAMGDSALLWCTGTEVESLLTTIDAAAPYDIALFYPGAPGDAALMMQWIAPRPVTIPAGATASRAYARTTATAAVTLDVRHNGSSVGSVGFAIGATSGTFTLASPLSVAAGDVVTVHNQATADTTLADVSISFAATR